MNAKRTAKAQWTAADRARHEASPKEFEDCPTQEELEAGGEYDGPIKSGAYFAIKVLIHELKKQRKAAGLTLAAVAKRTGMDQATLSRLENGRQPNSSVDAPWRYAKAVGRELVVTHAGPAAGERGNVKATNSARGGEKPGRCSRA